MAETIFCDESITSAPISWTIVLKWLHPHIFGRIARQFGSDCGSVACYDALSNFERVTGFGP